MPSESDLGRNQRILDVTKELSLQLGITNYNPTFVTWERFDSSRRQQVEIPADECLVGRWGLTLPESMKETLEADEWKAIIASSLIFSKKLRKRTLTGILMSAIPFVLLTAFLFIELPILFPQPYTVTKAGSSQTSPLGYYIAFLLAPILLLLGTALVSLTYARKTRLLADRKAADVVGAAVFLATLNKIADVSPPVMRQGIIGRYAPLLPSIQARISNLERYSASA